MRILAMVLVLFLGFAVPGAPSAFAQSGVQQTQANVDDLRSTLRGALNQAHQFIGSLLSEAKDATGLNDEQLFGVGVGALAGLLVADVVGSGALGTVFFAGAGGLFGKWVTTAK